MNIIECKYKAKHFSCLILFNPASWGKYRYNLHFADENLMPEDG